MTVDEAAALIADPRIDGTTWADLGCGDGTFTRALATLLPPGGVIHAMDRDRRALAGIPRSSSGTSIVTHTGDFTEFPWPFAGLDGVLLANALHYVRDQAAFVRRLRGWMKPDATIVLVEYDTDRPNPPWVPYPVPFSLPGKVRWLRCFVVRPTGVRVNDPPIDEMKVS